MKEPSYVYMLTNKRNTVLYVGMSNNLRRRVWEHKQKLVEGFTKRYNLSKLVYYECIELLENAIQREKQLKAGSRLDKGKLIISMNPQWKDLYTELD